MIRPREIKPDRYYIVDLYGFDDGVYALWNVFEKERQAFRAIDQALSSNTDRYIVCLGERLLLHSVEFYPIKYSWTTIYPNYPRWATVYKYDYPPQRLTKKERKKYRGVIQYHKRKFYK